MSVTREVEYVHKPTLSWLRLKNVILVEGKKLRLFDFTNKEINTVLQLKNFVNLKKSRNLRYVLSVKFKDCKD